MNTDSVGLPLYPFVPKMPDDAAWSTEAIADRGTEHQKEGQDMLPHNRCPEQLNARKIVQEQRPLEGTRA